nr:hypothetical protein [Tanacetum cinerariifolium]
MNPIATQQAALDNALKYGALIPDRMINDNIKLYVAYKTYLDYAIRKVPPKKARKFKKPASPKLKTVLVSTKEPTQKGERVKRPTKKVTTSPTTVVVIKDTPDNKDESDDVHDEDDNNDDDGNDDNSGNDADGGNDAEDSEQMDSDDDQNPSFTLKDYEEEEEQDEEYVHTPEKDKSGDEEEDDDVTKELYGDLNITQGLRDTDMINAEQGRADQQNAYHESRFVHKEKDAHVTLTTVHDKTEGPLQSSSISSDFTSKLLNLDDPSLDINSLMDTSTVPLPLPPFNQRVSTLEAKVSEFNQTSQFTEDVSSILGIVDNYLASKHKEEVNVAVRLQLNKLKEEVEAENQEFFDRLDSTIKAIIKEQVKAQVSKIIPQIEKYVTESLRAKVLAEELEFEAADTAMQQDQGNESGHIDDQPDNEAAPKHDWF